MIRALLASALMAAAGTPRPPAAPVHARGSTAAIGQWKLKTDRLNANLATGNFTAPAHVTLTRADGSVIVADSATGNYRGRRAVLHGHVSVHDPSGTFGLKSAQGPNPAQPHGPAVLSANDMRLDDAAHVYDATGNVHYQQGQTNVDSQNAHLNDVTHELVLLGKVHVVRGDQTLDADRATYNTRTGEGTAQSNVMTTFPGITPSFATPKPIIIKHPKIP